MRKGSITAGLTAGIFGLSLVLGGGRLLADTDKPKHGGTLEVGTVYVTLGRMEDKGYVASRLEGAPPAAGGLPRRVYAPTALGREVLGAWVTAANRFRVRFAR